MKRASFFICILLLLAGFFFGTLCPPGLLPWTKAPSASLIPVPQADASASAALNLTPFSQAPLNEEDNFSLLNTACTVALALREQDYNTLSSYVHLTKGVTFTPYSTVDFKMDLTFTAGQIRDMEQDATLYTWGVEDGRGDLIRMTMADYFSTYVFDRDYTQAPQVGIDRIIMSGNALENLTEAYPNCRFVDFCFPNQDADWCSLKLVFEPGDTAWQLVGIVHGQWTI